MTARSARKEYSPLQSMSLCNNLLLHNIMIIKPPMLASFCVTRIKVHFNRVACNLRAPKVIRCIQCCVGRHFNIMEWLCQNKLFTLPGPQIEPVANFLDRVVVVLPCIHQFNSGWACNYIYLFVEIKLVVIIAICRIVDLLDKSPTQILGIVAFLTPANRTWLLILSLVVSKDVRFPYLRGHY